MHKIVKNQRKSHGNLLIKGETSTQEIMGESEKTYMINPTFFAVLVERIVTADFFVFGFNGLFIFLLT